MGLMVACICKQPLISDKPANLHRLIVFRVLRVSWLLKSQSLMPLDNAVFTNAMLIVSRRAN